MGASATAAWPRSGGDRDDRVGLVDCALKWNAVELQVRERGHVTVVAIDEPAALPERLNDAQRRRFTDAADILV